MGSSTRGVFKQGRDSPGFSPHIEFVTFSSLGGVTDFGIDNGVSQDSSASSADNTRGIFGNGTGYDKKIQFITLASTGGTNEFGDLLFSWSSSSNSLALNNLSFPLLVSFLFKLASCPMPLLLLSCSSF